MQHFVQPVNVQALKQATEAVVGQEVTDTIVRVYRAIDQAMFEAYQMAKEDAEASLDEKLDVAFDTGYDKGYEAAEVDYELDGSDTTQDGQDVQGNLFDYAYDEGYVSGVADARARPGQADENVQDIMNGGAGAFFAALDQYDPSYVQDSGDEA